MLEDERNLIIRAIGGEAEAFGQLYDHYMPMIYRFILLKVAQREEAEDLTHQVFLKAWTNIGSKYSEKGLPLSSWLYRIARNTVIDHYRRTKPTSDLEEGEEREEMISRPDIHRKMDIESDARKAIAAMENLSDIEKDILIMRFIEDLPTKEVAEAVGKSEGAVKLAQHRALGKLRKIMEEDKNG
jgi:RNA polymerase sigma-70 factor (ECF subfamily)